MTSTEFAAPGDPLPLPALCLRSPHPHAAFSIDGLSAAAAIPGVRAVLVADEPEGSLRDDAPKPARGIVRYLGQAFVLVVADTAGQASQALAALTVHYEVLPAIGEIEDAMAYEADLVRQQTPGNIADDRSAGDEEATDAAFETAAHVVTLTVVEPMPARGAMAHDGNALRLAAHRMGLPVAWEVPDPVARPLGDAVLMAEMALDATGRFVAMRLDVLDNVGTCDDPVADLLPDVAAIAAPYSIQHVHVRRRGIHTHRPPCDVDADAMRERIADARERLIDQCARQLGLEPEAIRAINLGASGSFGSGASAGLSQALMDADSAGFAARAAEAKSRGVLLGRGLSCHADAARSFVQICEVEVDPRTGGVAAVRSLIGSGHPNATAGVNAVADALHRAYGIGQIDRPLDPARILAAIAADAGDIVD